jgi:2-amino-4-hydroxy-6-hydroxymethyldihydropteridine diphosphokinase
VARAYVSIGSNIDRERHIRCALHMLETAYSTLQCSAIYESKAVGFESAPFYNMVVGFETEESPEQVVATLRHIEEANGRTRHARGLTARTLDLDLLLYDDLVLEREGLTIPREDICRYAFVLRPLAEIAGERRHPVTGERFDAMWAAFAGRGQDLRRVEVPVAAHDERRA